MYWYGVIGMVKVLRNYMVDSIIHYKFKKWCFKNEKNMSEVISDYIRTIASVDETEKGKEREFDEDQTE